MTFYDRLQAICNDRGISVSNLCKQIGLNATTGATWKKRGSSPKDETIYKIAEVLDIDAFWFYVDPDDFEFVVADGFPYKSEDKGMVKAPVLDIKTWAEEKTATNDGLDEEFLLLAKKLSPAQRQRVMDFMRGVLS